MRQVVEVALHRAAPEDCRVQLQRLVYSISLLK
jgi:hypothetical protein